MRFRYLIVLTLLLAGCATDDVKETGITRATAIAIAERHCAEYPDTYGYVDRAEWNPDGKFWSVALTDYDSDHGKAYKISPGGGIIASHTIDRSADEAEYGPRHWGYWW